MFSHLLRAGLCSLALILCLSTANPVAAADPCVAYKKLICYEQRTTYVDKTEAYTKAVTLYDHCGRPYTVNKTFYRIVQVPVVETVRVVKYVKVAY